MKINLILSSRGQITLPAEFRKKYGFDEGSVIIAEDRGGEIVLKPAAVYEVQYYLDQNIERYVLNDSFKSEDEKKKIAAKLKKIKNSKK
jgi:antitoxin PrlF